MSLFINLVFSYILKILFDPHVSNDILIRLLSKSMGIQRATSLVKFLEELYQLRNTGSVSLPPLYGPDGFTIGTGDVTRFDKGSFGAVNAGTSALKDELPTFDTKTAE